MAARPALEANDFSRNASNERFLIVALKIEVYPRANSIVLETGREEESTSGEIHGDPHFLRIAMVSGAHAHGLRELDATRQPAVCWVRQYPGHNCGRARRSRIHASSFDFLSVSVCVPGVQATIYRRY
jgi:hypothetical protein